MGKRIMILLLIPLLLVFFVSLNAHANNLFVNEDGVGMDCTMENPCSSIQQAIDLASSDDYIHVGVGTYHENLTIGVDKAGLKIMGKGADDTVLRSAGGMSPPKFAPAGVPADIILDIFAPDVLIKGMTLSHPEDIVTKRDIGVFVRPPANNVTLKNLIIERYRIGEVLEPTIPGSRGILVFRAKNTKIMNNLIQGNYEDHIHLPTSNTLLNNNRLMGATRLGIVVIQENETSDSTNNIIKANRVSHSGSDGIQIQGDLNLIQANKLNSNAGAGIRLCGPCSGPIPVCVVPGQNAIASENVVKGNCFSNNALGDIMDCGEDNMVHVK